MDTRKKILTTAEAIEIARRLRAQGQPVKVATGWFDPLIASHARRLEALRDGSSRLIVIVTSPPRPVLPARARAELVAALSVVDFVVLSEEGPLEDFLAQLEADEVRHGEASDESIARDLIRHVHKRQSAG